MVTGVSASLHEDSCIISSVIRPEGIYLIKNYHVLRFQVPGDVLNARWVGKAETTYKDDTVPDTLEVNNHDK